MNNTQYIKRNQFMNRNIERLAHTASNESKLIIGLMSGTSLDGLDIALCRIKKAGTDTKLDLLEFITVSYPAVVVNKIKPIMSVPHAPLEEVCIANAWLGRYHADLIVQALKRWKLKASDIDCIASHGQTLYHAPAVQHRQENMPDSTLQVGDGDHIARKTGIVTVSDFRQKHIAAGGEGAPLAGLVDELLFRSENEDRLLLNIGGIANFTYLPATGDRNSLTMDTGPGNTMINAAIQKLYNKPFDRDGRVASAGTVHPRLLEGLKKHPYLKKPAPKTTGPEEFNLEWVREIQEGIGVHDLAPEDLVASLTRLSAETIADAVKYVAGKSLPEIYLSGGGMHNDQMMTWLSEELAGQSLKSFDEIGFDPDAKEAVCFAVLANEALSGEGFYINTDEGSRRVSLGKISFPD